MSYAWINHRSNMKYNNNITISITTFSFSFWILYLNHSVNKEIPRNKTILNLDFISTQFLFDKPGENERHNHCVWQPDVLHCLDKLLALTSWVSVVINYANYIWKASSEYFVFSHFSGMDLYSVFSWILLFVTTLSWVWCKVCDDHDVLSQVARQDAETEKSDPQIFVEDVQHWGQGWHTTRYYTHGVISQRHG